MSEIKFDVTETVVVSYSLTYNEDNLALAGYTDIESYVKDKSNNVWQLMNTEDIITDISYEQIDEWIDTDTTTIAFYD